MSGLDIHDTREGIWANDQIGQGVPVTGFDETPF